MRQLIDLLVAQHLHYLIISISISLGIYLWTQKQSLFSFSLRRLFSYFFLVWAFDQIINSCFIGWVNGVEKNLGVFGYLSALMSQEIANKKTFDNFYLSFSIFYNIILHAIFILITNSLFLSLSFALWNPKLSLGKISAKRTLSIFFFVLSGVYFMSQIGRFLSQFRYS